MSSSDNTPSPDLKRCSKCKEWKSRQEFHQHKGRKDGLAAWCKTCNCQNTSRYQKENRAIVAERQRQWRKNHPNYRRERYALDRNRELKRAARYRFEKRDRVLKAQAKWRDTHLDARRAYSVNHKMQGYLATLRRRARIRKLPDTMTQRDIEKCLAYFGHRCATCDRPQGFWHTLAMDHWIPLSSPECPGTVPQNMIPLCHGIGGCNNAKHDKDPREWLVVTFGKRKATKIEKQIRAYFDSLKGNNS